MLLPLTVRQPKVICPAAEGLACHSVRLQTTQTDPRQAELMFKAHGSDGTVACLISVSLPRHLKEEVPHSFTLLSAL